MSDAFAGNPFGETIFNLKYRHENCETWDALSRTVVEDVMRNFVSKDMKDAAYMSLSKMQWVPGGRYLAYAGRPFKAFNNCILARLEDDTREGWAQLSQRSELALMTGAGVGIEFSRCRPNGSKLSRTGGTASGPVSKALMINEIGRYVRQGGNRRSALYGSLHWEHQDIPEWLNSKNWDEMRVAGTDKTMSDLKVADFNFPCPLDGMNISINYDDKWLNDQLNPTFLENCRQSLRRGDPGFSFNFGVNENDALRNPCCEVVSADGNDVCCLASVNMAKIETLAEFREIVRIGTMFLLCGTLVADLPYAEVYKTREKNRRLGLGLMGMAEWLIQRGYRYEMNEELRRWMEAYRDESDNAARDLANKLGVSQPVARRAIAPTGTIGILAGTSTGLEPLFCAAYKRRYLTAGNVWKYQYVIDGVTKRVVERSGVDPETIETALDLANDYERRMRFQADVQDYVDMAISSTINMPAWGSPLNNEDTVVDFATKLAKYAPRLRGFTSYADGSRGGQPIERIAYKDAIGREGEEFIEEAHNVCDISGKSGTCGS